MTNGASTANKPLKDKFATSLQSLGLSNRYQKYKLVHNPFPAIGIFSLSCPTESQLSSEIFEGTAKGVRTLIKRTFERNKPTVIFVNADCGQGKSHFLGNLALHFIGDEKIYPLFCQTYTSGGFSIVAEKALQWIGLEGYCNLMFSFAESLGFEQDELFKKDPSYVFGELVSALATSFMVERKTVQRIMKPFLKLDEGYSKLIQTSHLYKNLILVTIAKLIKKTSDRKVLLIIDGLENRWSDMNVTSREWFFDNVIRFLTLTRGDSLVVFSDSNCLRRDFSQLLKTTDFECTVEKVVLPALNVFKALKLVSNHLVSARSYDPSDPSNDKFFPFTKNCVKHLRKLARGNTRQLVCLCHHLIEIGVDSKYPKIAVDALKCLES